jgi:transforming growth factor-beta-induced protein
MLTRSSSQLALAVVAGALIGMSAPVHAGDTCCSSGAANGVLASNKSSTMPNIVETAQSAGKFNTLLAAAKAAGLVDVLSGEGPLTVFAPTDDAFAKLPKGTVETLLKPENKDTLKAVLTYHVVPGKIMAKDVLKSSGMKTVNGQRLDFTTKDKNVMIDKATVVTADIKTSNGVIHVIDTVMLPSSKNLVETAYEAKTFGTLLAAAKAAGLVDVLSGEGPLTVFAPTDDAFAKLPAGTVESLLKPENKAQLAAILTYHVVPGRVYSEDALKAGRATTVQGGDVEISVKKDAAFVNNARLLKTDLDASNGVIHVIDTVILPPAG